ncbi:hypothetical protein FUA26_07825 [Seonamhaeicola algicola]|uniref:YhhN-like protein n=1 Tax=Seonamhaeicola algicola TaxID=1719036 RepID=A0A5C7AU95_9FLAO|nr:hypothetical protein [Seonamhaeicola algicola]TXE11961.1 hypothetical protein FUA26_07825 [Seonamhaeicola algicola]
MKKIFTLPFGKLFFSVFFVFVAAMVYCNVTSNFKIANYIYLLVIPTFLTVFISKFKTLNIGFAFFLVFAFLGNISSFFFYEDLQLKVASALYIIGFIYLIAVKLPKFKVFKLDKLVIGYLIMIFFIGLYFLYSLYSVLNSVVSDNSEVLLFAIKNFVVMFLALLAYGVYLSVESKQSVWFLISVIFLGFATVLNYVNLYYIYHWSFEMLEKIMYVSGVYFLINSMAFKESIEVSKHLKTSKGTLKMPKKLSSDNGSFSLNNY